ncbi:MAG: hypothetical protein HUJ51_05505 [Eggerthellaceae bacterium]|nr:hypothetical protein [Eggerthellaceae bacterium]
MMTVALNCKERYKNLQEFRYFFMFNVDNLAKTSTYRIPRDYFADNFKIPSISPK